MTNQYLIAASILSADFLQLKESIAECEAAGADWIHVDVMDGNFVPNITMGPFLVATFKRATKLPLDVHLMIERPEQYLEAFAEAGASHLTVHVETCPQLPETLKQIKLLGCLAGVTLNPATPVSAIEPVLHLADLVLVLSVNPGFSGQTFMPETVSKVAQVRKKLDEIHSSGLSRSGWRHLGRNFTQHEGCGRQYFCFGNCDLQTSKRDRSRSQCFTRVAINVLTKITARISP